MGRAKLKREVRCEELARLEEAARTEDEFKNVVKWYDKLDDNRERKERYHEQSMFADMFDWDLEDWYDDWFDDAAHTIEPYSDLIHMCICEFHDLVEDADVSRLYKKIPTEKQRKIFFIRTIIGCSGEQISECHEMSDRNVRKLIDLMIENIRDALFYILDGRRALKESLTNEQLLFCDNYLPSRMKKKSIDNPDGK